MPHLPLAIHRIQQRRNGPRQRGRVISRAELPGITKENANHFSRLQPGRNQATRQRFHRLSIFGIAEPSPARSIHQRRFLGMPSARRQNRIMHEDAVRVSVKLGAQHGGMIVAEYCCGAAGGTRNRFDLLVPSSSRTSWRLPLGLAKKSMYSSWLKNAFT